MTAPVVELRGVTRRFAGRAVVDAVDLSIGAGQLLAVLGPSGSGKSTTLRLIAGLDVPDAGEILVAGEVVAGANAWVPPERRRVGFVFQSFALFPHLTVNANVAFAASGAARVDELLALVDLTPRRAAAVHTLSGGEQQRVALARALAMDPRVVLLDEPFANLDAALRRQVRDGVASTLRARAATAILVTHDATEAFALADAVAVMCEGKIVQVGTPEQVYARPATLAAAHLTGEVVPLPARALGGTRARCALGEVALIDERPGPDGALVLMARPEQLEISADGTPARVVRRTYEGATTAFALEVGGASVTARTAGAHPAAVGELVGVRVRSPLVAFPAPASSG